jgi:hypothetical protein
MGTQAINLLSLTTSYCIIIIIKHLKTFLNVFKGHLISMIFFLKEEEEEYFTFLK